MKKPDKKGIRRIRIFVLLGIMLALVIGFNYDIADGLFEIFHVQIAKYIMDCEIVELPIAMAHEEIPGKLYFIENPGVIFSYEIATEKIDTIVNMEDSYISGVSPDLREITFIKPYRKYDKLENASLYWKDIDSGESRKIYEGDLFSELADFANRGKSIVFTAYPPNSGVYLYIADKSGALDSLPGTVMPKRYWGGESPFILYSTPDGELCRYSLETRESINIDTLITGQLAYIVDSTKISESHIIECDDDCECEFCRKCDKYVLRKIDIYSGEVDSIIYDGYTRNRIFCEHPDMVIMTRDFKAYEPTLKRVYSMIRIYEEDSLLWETWNWKYTDILCFSPDENMIFTYIQWYFKDGKNISGTPEALEFYILAPDGKYALVHPPVQSPYGFIGWR